MWNQTHPLQINSCASVWKLQSDLFRNTTVCLCGCLSTFTSYKKRRQNRGRDGAFLHSPCTHVPGLPESNQEVRDRRTQHEHRGAGWETLICTLNLYMWAEYDCRNPTCLILWFLTEHTQFKLCIKQLTIQQPWHWNLYKHACDKRVLLAAILPRWCHFNWTIWLQFIWGIHLSLNPFLRLSLPTLRGVSESACKRLMCQEIETWWDRKQRCSPGQEKKKKKKVEDGALKRVA